jgi:methyltransferase (TIGR00027 family)
MHRLTNVENTALLTAAARAQESRRATPLFRDPLAAGLASDQGRVLLREYSVRSGLPADVIVAATTRYFDDWLAHVMTGTPDPQVVLVAAGMDTRTHRMGWPPNTTVYEIDRPGVLALKTDLLTGGPPARTTVRRIPVDLTDDWAAALATGGFDPSSPSIWLLQGLLVYLDQPTVAALLDGIAALAVPGSVLGADMQHSRAFDHPFTRPLRELMAEWGTPWRFGTTDPVGLLGAHGWRASTIQLGDPAANYQRFAPPSAYPDLPRPFLVTAERVS